MSIHTNFLAGSPRCAHGDALAGGVQHIAKEIIAGNMEPTEAAKNILRMVNEYFEGRTNLNPQALKLCRETAKIGEV